MTQNSKINWLSALGLVILSMASGATAAATAPSSAADGAASSHRVETESALTLPIGHSIIVDTAVDISQVINANPRIVSVTGRGRRQLVLFGLADGATELRLINAAGSEVRKLDVVVEPDGAPLELLLREELGEKNIHVRRSAGSVILTGEVANAGRVALAGEIASKASMAGLGGGATTSNSVINLLHSASADQITVAVRVLEIKKAKINSVGFKWSLLNNATAKGVNNFGNVLSTTTLARPSDQFSLTASTTYKIGKGAIDAFVDFLRTEGQAKLLAEPTIVASSGKPAKFLAGGEFPVPVPGALVSGSTQTVSSSSGSTTQLQNTFQSIMYKQFGISLSFTATVASDGRIDLQVEPEVSSIDETKSIEYGGNHVPALATRRAETNLKLNSGETVVFAGLTAADSDDERTRLPVGGTRWLDFLAGPQTKSTSETELIIIVTPTIGPSVDEGAPAKQLLKAPPR
jgi:pilus assembly protein CpaC